MTKVTFTLDDGTVGMIRALAERKRRPRSSIVRDAVAAYARLEEKLDDVERTRRLRVVDDLIGRRRTRPQGDVEKELRAIRRSRHTGWRRPSD